MERRWSRKKRGTRDEDDTVGADAPDTAPAPVPDAAEETALRKAALDILGDRRAAPDDVRSPPEPSAPPPEAEPARDPRPGPGDMPESRADLWHALPEFDINVKHLEKNRIITAERTDPAHSAFDVLRTKLLRMLRENGWKRVAITSPTEGCGKTFMAVNLALSLSRQANCRTVLMDLDMRRPSVAQVLGLKDPPSMGDFLRGELPMEQLFRRAGPNEVKIGDTIAVAANGRREDYASELMQLPETAQAMDRMDAALGPDVVLFDMPPALVNDDVLAARPLFDGVLLIVGGGITKPGQVRDVERRLGTETPLLGVVLNRSEGEAAKSYSY